MLFAATIFLSASLLFLVQPLIAKQILPWFGGSAAVWTTCMVFFQLLLLAGYAYADQLPRRCRPRAQAGIHSFLLLISLALLPVLAPPGLKPAPETEPIARILLLLTLTVGLPYFLLSTTGPLLQRWLADRSRTAGVYRLYAWSNIGSLLGLLAYPFLIEPALDLADQARVWSVVYVLFVVGCTVCAWRAARAPSTQPTSDTASPQPPPRARQAFFWIAGAAVPSVLLLGVTSHLTQNIASIPFLWVLPLTLYLFSFVIVFEGRGGKGWYTRAGWIVPVLALAVAMAWGLSYRRGVMKLEHAIPLYAVGLFFACVFCHGEVALTKPAPRYLTRFYLALSAGGALGGLFVGLIAPRLFASYWELPLALVALCALSLVVCIRIAPSRWRVAGSALSLIALAGAGWYGWQYRGFLTEDTVHISRNFYGTVRIKEAGAGEWRVRRMLHGVILHGEQFLDPGHAHEPTSYYSESSGLGLAVLSKRERGPIKLCVIGLGTGTAAAWARAGDTLRFYEIDPDIVPLANRYFSYLRDTQARLDIVLGDGRLALERELKAGAPQACDVLAVDAFSSDAIPVHLITREAVELYAQHLKADGILAFHVSNRYLDLLPVVAKLAEATGFHARNISDAPVLPYLSHTDWVLMSKSRATLAHPDILPRGDRLPQTDIPLWTDARNNLLDALAK